MSQFCQVIKNDVYLKNFENGDGKFEARYNAKLRKKEVTEKEKIDSEIYNEDKEDRYSGVKRIEKPKSTPNSIYDTNKNIQSEFINADNADTRRNSNTNNAEQKVIELFSKKEKSTYEINNQITETSNNVLNSKTDFGMPIKQSGILSSGQVD